MANVEQTGEEEAEVQVELNQAKAAFSFLLPSLARTELDVGACVALWCASLGWSQAPFRYFQAITLYSVILRPSVTDFVESCGAVCPP